MSAPMGWQQTRDAMLSFQRQFDPLELPVGATQSGHSGEALPTFPDGSAFLSPFPSAMSSATATTTTLSNDGHHETLLSYEDVDVSRVKRESRALVLICPETNAPIEYYRSEQGSSSARSTASSDESSAAAVVVAAAQKSMTSRKLHGEMMSEGALSYESHLPVGSRLHRWLEIPKIEGMDWTAASASSSSGIRLDAPTAAAAGLSFGGLTSIWSASIGFDSGQMIPLEEEEDVGAVMASGLMMAADPQAIKPEERPDDDEDEEEDASYQQHVPKNSRLWAWIGDRDSSSSTNDADM